MQQLQLDFHVSDKELVIHEILGKLPKKNCITASNYIRKLLITQQLRRETWDRLSHQS